MATDFTPMIPGNSDRLPDVRSASHKIEVPEMIAGKLAAVIRRSRITGLLSGVIVALAVSLIVLLLAAGLDWCLTLFEPAQRRLLTTVSLSVMALMGIVSVGWSMRHRITRRHVARQIDEQIPELHERWTSVTSFAESTTPPEMQGSALLIQKVAEEAVRMGRQVDPAHIRLGKQIQVAVGCLAAVAAIWIVALVSDSDQMIVLVRRFFSPESELSLTQIQSNNSSLMQPRGSSLMLTATVTGRPRESGTLLMRRQDGSEETHRILLQNSSEPGNAPGFAFPIKDLQNDFSFRFRAGDGQTSWQTMKVADRPTLKNVELRIAPPEYSGIPETQSAGLPRSVRVLEGSRVTLKLEASEQLTSMLLVGDDRMSHDLSIGDDGCYQWDVQMQESWAFRTVMENTSGLSNELQSRCEIIVYRDQAPTVDVDEQFRDISLRPDDTLTIDFEARDDLGISRAELVIMDPNPTGSGDDQNTNPSGPKELKTIPIPLGDQAGAKNVRTQAELSLKDFQLKHGQQLTYAIRVYDTKNTVTTQVTSSEASASKAASQNAQPASPGSQLASSDSQRQQLQDQESRPEDAQQGDAAEKKASEPSLAGGNQWKPKESGNKPTDKKEGGETTGAPRPEFNMAKHQLDTPGQCSSCTPRRIHIDEWAGSYTSKVLDKLQLQIDPVLTALKQILTQARDELKPVQLRQKSEQEWEQKDSEHVRRTDELLSNAEQHVRNLTDKSSGTPYAFIGLQLQDIQQLHVHAARGLLNDVTLLDVPCTSDDVAAATVHIQRAIELLEKLTQQYEAVKLNQKLADTMLRIRKMHQIFLTGTFAMLKSQKPNMNPKQRAFMELDLSDEYLKQLQALLKKKLEIQAELAKLLSQDPRLLERFMARSRLEATTLRDQLTLLNRRQQRLLRDTKDGLTHSQDADVADAREDSGSAERADEKETDVRFQLKDQLQHRVAAAGQIVDQASQMLDNLIVWLPRDLDPMEKVFAGLKAQGIRIVSTATEMANQSKESDPSEARETSTQLYEQLRAFQEALPRLLDPGQHPKLPTHVANRLQETEKLITEVSGWIRRQQLLDDGKDHLAVEIDQHRITVDTMELNRKLTSLSAQCQGISPELAEAARVFLATMEDDLIPELEQAQIGCGKNDIPRSIEHQSASLSLFTRAEQELDEIMDGIIKHLDSLPYNKSPSLPPGAEPPSVDDLLALLEDEARAAESLGIPCCRPSNLLVEKDWFSPGASCSNPGSGGGSGSGSGGSRSMQATSQMMQARLGMGKADQLREQTEKAIKSLLAGSGGSLAKTAPRKPGRAWNTLGSRLEDQVRQGRGNLPPEQYRDAIEQYFETLSGNHAQPVPAENKTPQNP